MASFSLLYRVFFDRSLAEKILVRTKGSCFSVLAKLAFTASFFWALGAYFAVRPLTIDTLAPILNQNSEIRFEAGKITKPENYEYSYISPEKDFFFVFNTTEDLPSFENLPAKGMYLSQTKLFLIGGHFAGSIPLAQLFERYGNFSVSNTPSAHKMLEGFVAYLHRTFPVLVFAVLGAMFSATFCLCAFFFSVMSFFMTPFFRLDMPFDMRLRLGTISFLPFAVLNSVAMLAGIGLTFMIATVVTGVYMFCFLTEYARLTPVTD